MMIVNQPTELIPTQCYKCKAVFMTHPMHCANSPFIINCNLHKPKCIHDFQIEQIKGEPMVFEIKCKLCGELYK